MSAHSGPTWLFQRIDPGLKHVGPTHGEHLAPRGVVDPLVRESIQNSLDATDEGSLKPSQVVFTLGEADPRLAGRFFDGLRRHLQTEPVPRSLPEGLPAANEPIRFLAVEDFNTRGLEGDPDRWEQTNGDGSKNHFFRFWHKVGQYEGDVKRRGSWGVGKVVFSNASRIRTFFGLTVRPNDQNPLLMGEASLVIHKLPGEKEFRHWYGYYACSASNEGWTVPSPIRDVTTISDFSESFSIDRRSAGLSVIVPFLRESVDLNELARSVVDNYFLAILEGRLEVKLQEGGKTIFMDRSTIADALQQITWRTRGISTREETAALVDLARWQIGLRAEDYVQLEQVGIENAYALSSDRFSKAIMQRLSQDFALKKRIAVRIPVIVRPKGRSDVTDEVRLVLERDESLRKSNVPHLRSGINISKLRDRGSGVRGLLLVSDDPAQRGELDKLLQASEGPAHLNWETSGESYDKAKAQYDDAHKVILFMRNLAENFVECLSSPQETRDIKTLAPFFPDFDELGAGDRSPHENRPGQWGRDKLEPTALPPPSPPGVIEGIIRVLSFAARRVVTVEGATIDCLTNEPESSTPMQTTLSNAQGRFRFANLVAGEYRIAAKKGDEVAQKTVTLPSGNGIHVELLLRKPSPPKQYVRVQLESGFRIQGNSKYRGALKPIRVQLAYAAWGGSRAYNPADFDLNQDSISVVFTGLRETERSQIVSAPNVLRFTPIAKDFRVDVRGFDARRALCVDPRTLDAPASDEGGEE